jgi:hypothetical protein
MVPPGLPGCDPAWATFAAEASAHSLALEVGDRDVGSPPAIITVVLEVISHELTGEGLC